MKNYYTRAVFLKSAAKFKQLPLDEGIEIAFVGRSNVGKSSVLNALTNQRRLAKTSKTPGRTQLINLFYLDDFRRIVDVPGYGYASVPQTVKISWQKNLSVYLENRLCLEGVIILVDSRHKIKDLDKWMIEYALKLDLKVHILLTKTDKISKSSALLALKNLEKLYENFSPTITIQLFSAHNNHGLDQLIDLLNKWYNIYSNE